MSLIGSVAIVIGGALLYWHVEGSLAGISAGTYVVILIVAGAIGVVASLFLGPGCGAVGERTVEEERPLSRR